MVIAVAVVAAPAAAPAAPAAPKAPTAVASVAAVSRYRTSKETLHNNLNTTSRLSQRHLKGPRQ